MAKKIKNSILKILVVLSFGIIPAIIGQFFSPEPTSREIHISSFRYGKDPSVIRANRGDTLKLTFSTEDTGHSFFLEEFNIDAKVSPARETVEVFEEPPEGRAQREQPEEELRFVRQQAAPGAAVGQRIDDDDVGEPLRREGVELQRFHPRHARPGQYPKHDAQSNPQPSPPWEASLCWRGGGLSARADGVCPSSTENAKQKRNHRRKDRDGQPNKHRPGKRGVLHVLGAGREFEVVREVVPGQPNPAQRQAEQQRDE